MGEKALPCVALDGIHEITIFFFVEVFGHNLEIYICSLIDCFVWILETIGMVW